MKIPSVSKETLNNEYGVMYEVQGNPEPATDYYFKAATESFDNVKFDKYQEAIERCKKKIQLKNSIGDFQPRTF